MRWKHTSRSSPLQKKKETTKNSESSKVKRPVTETPIRKMERKIINRILTSISCKLNRNYDKLTTPCPVDIQDRQLLELLYRTAVPSL